MNFIIRAASINDLDNGLLKVFIDGYRYHQNGRDDVYPNVSDDDLKQDLIENFQKLSTIVILNNDVVIGYLSYRIKEKYSKKLDVDQLVIDEKYRNHGLGKKLIEEVKKIALDNNCDRIELNCWMFNENALGMYEHIGFKKQRIIYEMSLDK